MSRHFKTLIAAIAMLGFVGAASVNAQTTPPAKNPPQAGENKDTNPAAQNETKPNPNAAPANPNLPKGKNPPQADDSKDANPSDKKKN